jgi:ornithine cyclodeaminase
MTENPIWITEADVVSLMHLGEAIDALEAGLMEARAGHGTTMSKTHLVWNAGDTLHAIGAVFDRKGWFGTKSWGHTAGGATPLFLLWNADGHLAAVIEAFALGQMRTGGMSGVAARWMAVREAKIFAVIGSGKQALAQVAAVALVRPIKEVRVYSPNPTNRASFVTKLHQAGFDFDIVDADSIGSAVANADIVTTVTRSREAFLSGEHLLPNVHINAVGAITPERREIVPELAATASRVAVDDHSAAMRLAAEFRDAFGATESDWVAVGRLADLVGAKLQRPPGRSIFKAMGMGLSDLSLAVALHDRARASGVGRAFSHPQRVPPRLRAS